MDEVLNREVNISMPFHVHVHYSTNAWVYQKPRCFKSRPQEYPPNCVTDRTVIFSIIVHSLIVHINTHKWTSPNYSGSLVLAFPRLPFGAYYHSAGWHSTLSDSWGKGRVGWEKTLSGLLWMDSRQYLECGSLPETRIPFVLLDNNYSISPSNLLQRCSCAHAQKLLILTF